jgi:hypothetical protein
VIVARQSAPPAHAIAALMEYVRPTRSKAQDASACWEWLGAMAGGGVAKVPQWRIPGDGRRVNPRAVLLALKTGRPIEHLAIAACGNRWCVNPHHALDAKSDPRQSTDPRLVRAVRALSDLGWTANRVAEVLELKASFVHQVVRGHRGGPRT